MGSLFRHVGSFTVAAGSLELWFMGLVVLWHVGSWFPDQGSNWHLPALQVLFFFFLNIFKQFIYFWLLWIFVTVHGLSLVVESSETWNRGCVPWNSRWIPVHCTTREDPHLWFFWCCCSVYGFIFHYIFTCFHIIQPTIAIRRQDRDKEDPRAEQRKEGWRSLVV